jgi:hypothetical protein
MGNCVAVVAVAAHGERHQGGARGRRCRGPHQQRARCGGHGEDDQQGCVGRG